MKWRNVAVIAALLCVTISTSGYAKGGFSGGGGRGSFSSGSSSPRSSSGSPYRSAPAQTTTTTTRTTTSGKSYGNTYGGGYYYHPMMMYPGFGMGYGYSNGLVEGLIIGNLMHPQGTTVYSGGGYNGNALLYPDGRVVDQNGYQVGTYANGQFAAVQNGSMVAQPAPQPQQPAPMVVVQSGPSIWHVWGYIAITMLVFFPLFVLVAWMIEVPVAGLDTETVTETTTVYGKVSAPSPVGMIKRKQENSQFYVIDPSDQSKTWVNDSDDMYEDAAGRVWRLI